MRSFGARASALAAALCVVAPPNLAVAQSIDELQERQRQERTEDRAAEAEKPKLTPEEELEIAYRNLQSPEEPVWRAAEKKITKAWTKSGSDSMDLLLSRGRAAIEREDWEAALEHLTDLVNLAPDFAEGWNARAAVHYRQNALGPALADLAEAVAKNPRHFSAFAGLGVIFEQIDDAQRAIAAYREALEIHPNLEAARDAVRRLSKDADGRPA